MYKTQNVYAVNWVDPPNYLKTRDAPTAAPCTSRKGIHKLRQICPHTPQSSTGGCFLGRFFWLVKSRPHVSFSGKRVSSREKHISFSGQQISLKEDTLPLANSDSPLGASRNIPRTAQRRILYRVLEREIKIISVLNQFE